MRKDSGMTLIETLVAVAILAMIEALVFPSLEHAMTALSFRRAVARTEIVLRQARGEAIAKNLAMEVWVSPDGSEIVTAAFRTHVDEGTVSMPPNGITFYGDGSSSGGSVVVVMKGQRARLSVNPVSGAIGL
jgi:prepilin-type N-terminal cleavage/methylation domain-containing protein